MKTNQFFVGNVMKCKNYESDVFVEDKSFKDDQLECYSAEGYSGYDGDLVKEKAILIKLNVDEYIDIDNVKSTLALFKIYKYILKVCKKGKVLSTSPDHNDMLYIDFNSLKPYYAENQKVEKISLRQFKKNLNAKGCDIEW